MTDKMFDTWVVPSAVELPDAESSSVSPGFPGRVLSINPDWLNGLVDALIKSHETFRKRKVSDLAKIIATVGNRFLKEGDPLRMRALELLPGASGISSPMAQAILDGMAADWTEESICGLLTSEFNPPEILDGFIRRSNSRTMAVGADLCVQVISGSVPGVGVTALIRSLLTKAPTLLKPGRGDALLPVLFAEALGKIDPALREAVAVLYWPGGNLELEKIALAKASVVTAYGDDESVASIRALTPVTKRFVAYHHRVSIGIVGAHALTSQLVEQTARDIAQAVAVFDQRGCVSPGSIYVDSSGYTTPEIFAERLVSALELVENDLPGGNLELEEQASLHQIRGAAEMIAASGSGVKIYHGDRASWTVIFDPHSELRCHHVGRVVHVVPIRGLASVAKRLDSDKEHLQSVGVAGVGAELEQLAEELGRLGVTRITKFSRMPFPPSPWHHDGRSPLRDLVRWVDLEKMGG